jgi:hypothetical protein
MDCGGDELNEKMGLVEGTARSRVSFEAQSIGDDCLVTITGGKEHVGSVAVASFHEEMGRAYSSVLTLPGHREDRIAKESSEKIAKELQKRVVVVAGIHLDDITSDEIEKIILNCKKVVDRFIRLSKEEPSVL